MSDLAPGTLLDARFEIVGVLGRGGMATVYLANDRLRGERVALKLLHEHLAGDPGSRARLRREVLAASRVRHPHALVATELHEIDGQLVLAMPFHPGRSLAEVLSTDGPLPPDQVRRLGARLSEALGEAHRQGVLHRDLTPANVMLDDRGSPSLTDFGLARLGDGTATRATAALGTTGYAAPEVYEGVRADPRSDLYGLGAVLYEAATGQAPWGTGHPGGVLQRQLSGQLKPVQELDPRVPDDLAQTIEALLDRDPGRRPQGCDEVGALLRGERTLTPAPTGKARPVPARLPPGEWTVRVRERDPHRGRRKFRRAARRMGRNDGEAMIHALLEKAGSALREWAGLPEGPPPEDLMTAAVARQAGLPADALETPNAVFERRFRLVDGVSQECAESLAAEVRRLGFSASTGKGSPSRWSLALLIPILWVLFPAVMATGAPDATVFGFVAATVALALVGRATGLAGNWKRLPLAFPQDLSHSLAADYRPALAAPEPERSPEPPTLADRAHAELDALAALLNQGELSAPALSDLKTLVRQLRAETGELAADVERFEAELARGGPEADTARLAAQLERLQTLAKAGQGSDELERVRAALAAAEASARATAALEAQLTAATARLLEIASTAQQSRRVLLSEAEPARSAERLAKDLRTRAAAAAAARREVEG